MKRKIIAKAITDAGVIARFLLYVGPVEACGCQLWMGGVYSKKKNLDYGCFRIGDDEKELAHRAAYRIFKGPIPPEMVVRHSCDTPRCVAEDHLLLGTPADNTRDMIDRGRARFGENLPRGETHPRAKLTTAQVEAIRLDTRSQRVVAAEYGVSGVAICLIRQGKSRALGWIACL